MPSDPAYSRRLLLGHGLGAALLLPTAVHPAASPQRPQRPVPSDTRPLVVLDPGHGGSDTGAIGAGGTCEKHVVFAVAGELARRLRAAGRYRVSLTRENDVFIPHEDRVAVAVARNAALFVSIHAGAAADPAVRGATICALAVAAADSPLPGDTGRSAGLAVLTAADLPGALVQVGFMSSAQDEAALRKPAHHAIVASAIHGAIDEFFAGQPASAPTSG